MSDENICLTAFIVTTLIAITGACVTPNEASQTLHYSKDYRTGLCFASRNINDNRASMTNVPCTREVLQLIPGSKRE